MYSLDLVSLSTCSGTALFSPPPPLRSGVLRFPEAAVTRSGNSVILRLPVFGTARLLRMVDCPDPNTCHAGRGFSPTLFPPLPLARGPQPSAPRTHARGPMKDHYPSVFSFRLPKGAPLNTGREVAQHPQKAFRPGPCVAKAKSDAPHRLVQRGTGCKGGWTKKTDPDGGRGHNLSFIFRTSSYFRLLRLGGRCNPVEIKLLSSNATVPSSALP